MSPDDPLYERGMGYGGRCWATITWTPHSSARLASPPTSRTSSRATPGVRSGPAGLDRRTRSCITLMALMALGRLEELELHVRAALRNGLERG